MEQFSVSFTLGKASAIHGANLNHNNRKFTASNVDETRISQNLIFKQQDVRDAYRQLFDKALHSPLLSILFYKRVSVRRLSSAPQSISADNVHNRSFVY